MAESIGITESITMENTQTPISERTDEQLVRTIAEWMGIGTNGRWNPDAEWLCTGLNVGHDGVGGPILFSPQSRPSCRERVMLAMGSHGYHNKQDALIECWQKVDGNYEVYVRVQDGQSHRPAKQHSAVAPTLGRAFCEAVVAWIEAQGEGYQR